MLLRERLTVAPNAYTRIGILRELIKAFSRTNAREAEQYRVRLEKELRHELKAAQQTDRIISLLYLLSWLRPAGGYRAELDVIAAQFHGQKSKGKTRRRSSRRARVA